MPTHPPLLQCLRTGLLGPVSVPRAGSSWRAVVRPMSRPVPNRFAAAGAGCATPASGAHALAVFGGCNFEGDCGDVLVVTTQAV